MVKDKIAVKVQGVSKSFRIPLEGSNGVKQKIINHLKGRSGYREFTPLNDISFEIEKGDFFGIVGRNGSGKSTLLKTLAGIYSPNKGAVTVNGTLVPFIELGVGFNPELTGRENVFLNGALLGFSRDEMEAMYDGIVDFAELHDFMEERLKNYSSGMQVRLAFSIAIRADGDILLLDEVLAVGDEAFQRKCFQYFAQLKKDKRTVILVTHDMNSVARFCSKAMLIDNGSILSIGDIKDVVRGYERLNQPVIEHKESLGEDGKEEQVDKVDTSNGKISVSLNKSTNDIVDVAAGERLEFEIKIDPKVDMQDIFMGLTIQKSSGEYVYWYTTEKDRKILKLLKAHSSVKIKLSVQNIFGNGDYSVNINIKKSDRTKDYIIVNDAAKFTVSGWDAAQGWMYHPDIKVERVDA